MSNPNVKNLQELVGRGKLSQSGADWLRTAFDPFHDYAHDFEGFPDLVSSKSKVQMLTKAISISSPDGNAYSARIWMTDQFGSSTGNFHPVVAQAPGYLDVDRSGSYGNVGLFEVEAWNGVSNPNSSLPGATFTRQAVTAMSSGEYARLIAVGFEVHNTTPMINMSGTCTVSTVPNVANVYSRAIEDTTAVSTITSYPVKQITLPPTDATTALLVPGATQWHAKDGAYVVPHLMQPVIPVEGSNLEMTMYSASLVGPCALQATTNEIYPHIGNFHHAFNRPFILLSGLDGLSTFTVTFRTYVEYFPNPSSTIMSFATPSPAYDPKALQLYGLIAAELPLAVPVAMNAKGDYFRMVLSALSSSLKHLGPMAALVHPAGPAAAAVAAEVAKLLSKRVGTQPEKKKKAQKASKGKSVGWGSVNGVPSSK
jgi:hypothetical protein